MSPQLQLKPDARKRRASPTAGQPLWRRGLYWAPVWLPLVLLVQVTAFGLRPALEQKQRLAESEAEVRHVILLSDGKTYADDYEELVSLMSDSEITVSSVAVGQEADRELLANIAEWGRGRSYFIQDAERVPRIFIQETQIASQSTLVEEPVETTVTTSIEAWRRYLN